MEGEIQGKQLIAPRPSTRENGAKERDDGEAGSGAIRDDDGRSKRSEGNGMRRASTKGTASTASSDARGGGTMSKTMKQRPRYRRITSPMTRSKQHAPSADLIPHRTDKKSKQPTPAERHRPARRHEGRGGGETKRYDTRNRTKGETASRETMPHDRQRAGQHHEGARQRRPRIRMTKRHRRRGKQAGTRETHDAPQRHRGSVSERTREIRLN